VKDACARLLAASEFSCGRIDFKTELARSICLILKGRSMNNPPTGWSEEDTVSLRRNELGQKLWKPIASEANHPMRLALTLFSLNCVVAGFKFAGVVVSANFIAGFGSATAPITEPFLN
jgi:hypothetical protein